MLRHRFVVGLALFVLACGCTMSRGGRRGTIIAGAAMTATSILLIRSGEIDRDHDGRCDAAWIMWTDLQKLDASYARAMREGPVMVRCAM